MHCTLAVYNEYTKFEVFRLASPVSYSHKDKVKMTQSYNVLRTVHV